MIDLSAKSGNRPTCWLFASSTLWTICIVHTFCQLPAFHAQNKTSICGVHLLAITHTSLAGTAKGHWMKRTRRCCARHLESSTLLTCKFVDAVLVGAPENTPTVFKGYGAHTAKLRNKSFRACLAYDLALLHVREKGLPRLETKPTHAMGWYFFETRGATRKPRRRR